MLKNILLSCMLIFFAAACNEPDGTTRVSKKEFQEKPGTSSSEKKFSLRKSRIRLSAEGLIAAMRRHKYQRFASFLQKGYTDVQFYEEIKSFKLSYPMRDFQKSGLYACVFEPNKMKNMFQNSDLTAFAQAFNRGSDRTFFCIEKCKIPKLIAVYNNYAYNITLICKNQRCKIREFFINRWVGTMNPTCGCDH